MIQAIDHLNIVVSDLERSLEFYTGLLDFKLTRRAELEGDWIERIVGLQGVKARVAYILAQGGEPRIELLQYLSPAGKSLGENSFANTIGLRHIALRVDDIDQAAQKLHNAGVKLFSEPAAVPAAVVEHDAGRKTLLYFTDPDGVILELAQYL